MIRSEKGIALVLTLMILAIVTALVVEFAYGVYTTTSGLYNWRDSQRLSFVAKSGVSLAVKTVSDNRDLLTKYATQERYMFPVENIVEGFNGSVVITLEDENAKFNLNALRNQQGEVTADSVEYFKRLLKALNLNQDIAKSVADWLDTDSEPRLSGSEEGAKNTYMDSVDELLLIKGIDRTAFERLSPYVTVYGNTDNLQVNINTASIPVIMSLAEGITSEHAEGVVRQRQLKGFSKSSEIVQMPGMDKVNPVNLVYEPSIYHITTTAEEDKIKRIVECVVSIGSGASTVKYWREM